MYTRDTKRAPELLAGPLLTWIPAHINGGDGGNRTHEKSLQSFQFPPSLRPHRLPLCVMDKAFATPNSISIAVHLTPFNHSCSTLIHTIGATYSTVIAYRRPLCISASWHYILTNFAGFVLVPRIDRILSAIAHRHSCFLVLVKPNALTHSHHCKLCFS